MFDVIDVITNVTLYCLTNPQLNIIALNLQSFSNLLNLQSGFINSF